MATSSMNKMNKLSQSLTEIGVGCHLYELSKIFWLACFYVVNNKVKGFLVVLQLAIDIGLLSL